MGGSWDYLDFDLAVTRLDDGFEVRVLDSPAGETGAIRTTFDSESAGAAVDDVVGGRTSPSARDVGQRSFEPREDDERRIGEALFKAVFSDDVLTRYRDSVNRATASGTGLRIVLRFGGGADVLPWELLRDGPVFLGSTRRTAIVRCIEMPTRVAPPKIDGPLRILVAVSTPAGLAPIDARREHELLTGACLDGSSPARSRSWCSRMLRSIGSAGSWSGWTYMCSTTSVMARGWPMATARSC